MMKIMLNEKGFSLLVVFCIIVALLVLGLGAFRILEQNQPKNPTYTVTGWKIYQNQDYGFEIEYPRDWTIYKYSERPLDIVFTSDQEKIKLSSGSNSKIGFAITIYPKPFSTNELKQNGSISALPGSVTYQTITFQGIDANKYYGTSSDLYGETLTSRLIFNREGNGWALGWPNKNSEGKYDPVFDHMLSTFKFMDQSQATSSANQ